MSNHLRSVRLPLIAALAMVAAICVTASADLVGRNVKVSYSESGFTDQEDTVPVGAGAEIKPLDGSAIGDNILLDDESIDIGADTILVVIQGGGAAHSTGYQKADVGPDAKDDARYVFSGLSWPAGDKDSIVTSVNIELQDIDGVTLGSEVTFTRDSVTLVIGTLGINATKNVGSVKLTLSLEVLQGDANGDECINVLDLLAVRANLGKTGSEIYPPETDTNGDGKVNVLDLLSVRANLGKGPGCF